MKKKVYKLTRLAPEKVFLENEAKGELKKLYTEYLEKVQFTTQGGLIKAIKDGTFFSAEYSGTLEDEG